MGAQSAVEMNWERKVREFGKLHGFESYRAAIEWLVKRDSLETILGLIGAEIVGDQNKLKPWLNALGAWLDRRGYTVPPMYCPTNSYAYDSDTRIGEHIAVNAALSNSSAGLRISDYLKIRLSGASRTKANRDMGINPSSFYALLDKWGIKDKESEMELLNRIKQNPSTIDEMDKPNIAFKAPSKPVDATETPTDYKRTVALHLTLTEAVIRESINALVEATEGWTATLPVDRTLTGAIWASMARARQSGEDVATELVKRLREVAG